MLVQRTSEVALAVASKSAKISDGAWTLEEIVCHTNIYITCHEARKLARWMFLLFIACITYFQHVL